MGSKAKGGVAGFIYRFSLHMGVCRGPVDEIVAIRADDLDVWADSAASPILADTDAIVIDKPELFGGYEKEGGIVGGLSVLMGEPTQDMAARTVKDVRGSGKGWMNSLKDHGSLGIAALMGGKVPGFRGVTTLFFRGQIAANNPYPKPWKIRVRRALKGWDGPCWYPEKARIWLEDGAIGAMNPAHVLFECVTNRSWGRGFPRETIDEPSWNHAANILCEEAFGVCIRWSREEPLSEFMQRVLDHIAAVMYVDRQSGLIALRLIRQDYTAAQLPVFGPDSGLLGLERDDTGSTDNLPNEIVVKYRSPVDDKDHQVRAHNLAAFQSQGAVVSARADYPGAPTFALAARLALRDLRVHSAALKRYKVRLDRRGWKIEPAGCFRVSDPERGIEDVVLRAGAVEESEPGDGSITITALEDVFGLPVSSYLKAQEPLWQPADRSAAVPEARRLLEASYRDAYRRLGEAGTLALPADAAFLATLGAQPTALSASYAVAGRPAGGEWLATEVAPWTPTGTLAAAIGPYDTAIALAGLVQAALIEDEGGPAVQIGEEVVRLDGFDPATGAATVARGCLDTLPQAHAAGARVWFIDAGAGTDGREYASGETAEAKLLTLTSSAQLAFDLAPTDSIVFGGRLARPYPPGAMTLNGVPLFDALGPVIAPGIDLAFAWVHRNRATQADVLFAHGAAGVAPEAGATYTVRVRSGAGGALLREEAGIAGTAWTYTEAMRAADGGANALRFEIAAVRDGLESWQPYRFTVNRLRGFDMGFDTDFNGSA